MKQNAKYSKIFLLTLLMIFIVFGNLKVSEKNSLAGISQAPTLAQILDKRKSFNTNSKKKGENKLVNILIVPGHDDKNFGTEFQGLKEVELNRMLGQKLYEYLSNEPGINPVLLSTQSGDNPIFEEYFKNEGNKIQKFMQTSKESFMKKINQEELDSLENNFHNTASDEVRQRLYGINNWINNKKFDLVIHIHFNDHPGRKWNKEGKYDGFSIYTPGPLFQNYSLSKDLADSIYSELKKVRQVSNLAQEEMGIIEDHELIALGANGSLKAGSILIEYGYIYEPVILNPETRETSLDYFAYLTYAGIKKMLNEVPQEKEKLETSITRDKTSKDNLTWQFQKAFEGIYPPQEKSLRDCPITGYFGECSRSVQ